MTPEEAVTAAEDTAEAYQQAVVEVATETMRNALGYVCNDLLRVATEHEAECDCSTCGLLRLLVAAYKAPRA